MSGSPATDSGDRSATAPRHVWVYGNDHSPWVQAVLLGLHERGIDHTLVTVPPLSVFAKSGVLMPAAKIDDGPWILDSERILVELGTSRVAPEVHRALQRHFLMSALTRTQSPWQFWSRFSRARDGHPSAPRRLWNHFWRAFSIFYFFSLISVASRSRPQPGDEAFSADYEKWQERLGTEREFFGGGAPDTVDYQLFGLVQMHSSIPGRALAVLQDDPKLDRIRAWTAAMQARMASYSHLYSATDLEPRLPAIRETSGIERLCFWSGAAVMWLAAPITLPMVLFFVWRVRRLNEEMDTGD